MDPVLVDPFECVTNTFEPAVDIDGETLQRGCDAVVLSHEHGDHFCVRSLDQIARDRTIVYPAGCELIEYALGAMGFCDLRPVVPGQTVTIGGLELLFTPSRVAFPEMGVVFSHDGHRVWNQVDTEVDDQTLAVVNRGPQLAVMLAGHQVLIEEELGCDGLGSEFPYQGYAERLRRVLATRPRCVVPSSCGYRYRTQAWLNQRGFPIDEQQFLDDLSLLVPELVGRRLAPGDMLDTADFTIHTGALAAVRRRAAAPAAVEWRPDRGVPALADEDPYGHGAARLRAWVHTLLAEDFLVELASPRLRAWRARMAAARVAWELDVVYPDGLAEVRWIDLAASPLTWLDAAPRKPKIITAICASTLVGLRSGEATPYRALFTRRVVMALYASAGGSIACAGSVSDEPVAQALFPTANRRNVEWDLARLGYPRGGGRLRARGVRVLPRRL